MLPNLLSGKCWNCLSINSSLPQLRDCSISNYGRISDFSNLKNSQQIPRLLCFIICYETKLPKLLAVKHWKTLVDNTSLVELRGGLTWWRNDKRIQIWNIDKNRGFKIGNGTMLPDVLAVKNWNALAGFSKIMRLENNSRNAPFQNLLSLTMLPSLLAVKTDNGSHPRRSYGHTVMW